MIYLIRGELKRYVYEVKAYYPDQIVSIIVTVILFSIFTLVNNNAANPSFYVGYVYWYLMSSLISESSISISTEKQMGTINQLLLSKFKIEYIITIKTLVWLIINFCKVVIVLGIIALLFNLKIKFNIILIPVFLLSSLGMFGFTLILSALTLKYTKTASFETIISYTFLLLSGAIVPLDSLPPLAAKISFAMPLTLGIHISRQIINTAVVNIKLLILLCGNSILYITFGYLLFTLIKNQCLKDGVSSSY